MQTAFSAVRDLRLPGSIFVFCLSWAIAAQQAKSAELVRAELAKQEAWTGEAVPLVITLYSPGPFSGTATFDLPELPRTAILATGSPVVGSTSVDGETRFSQRHQFNIFTQQTGEITLPTFEIRFSGKRTFTSAPEPMVGKTQTLVFRSKRPPGTDSLGFVMAASSLEISQTWTPSVFKSLRAGDVVERRIDRQASGTTAMMFVPSSQRGPAGVRVYPGKPVVEDHSDRGDTTAIRSETIKYQFERAGTFELPEQSFAWWDTTAGKLQTSQVPGITVSVRDGLSNQADTESPPPSTFSWTLFAVLCIGLSGLVWLGRQPAVDTFIAWQSWHNQPEHEAARQLVAACRNRDRRQAFQAAAVFCRHSETFEPATFAVFQLQVDALAEELYSASPNSAPWSSQALLDAYRGLERKSARRVTAAWATRALPPLNPDQRTS